MLEKSTIINSIVGQEILSSKNGEYIYRTVIIKHRNII